MQTTQKQSINNGEFGTVSVAKIHMELDFTSPSPEQEKTLRDILVFAVTSSNQFAGYLPCLMMCLRCRHGKSLGKWIS
jgi:hypothetical protein